MWPFLPSKDWALIPTYYLFASLAFTLGVFWIYRRAQKLNINTKLVLDLCLFMMIGIFLGGRFFHVIFEELHFYIQHPLSIFKFWIGGFVFYGGFLGALTSALIFYKFRPFDFYKLADLMAPVFAFGYGLGRWGCFFAGCCFGKSTAMPWGVVFPPWGEAPPLKILHPTQLYSVFWEWSVLAALLVLEKRLKSSKPGLLFGVWLVLHGLGRAFIEQFRDDFRGQNVFNLSISTWISIALIGGGIYLIKEKRKV